MKIRYLKINYEIDIETIDELRDYESFFYEKLGYLKAINPNTSERKLKIRAILITNIMFLIAKWSRNKTEKEFNSFIEQISSYINSNEFKK